MPGPATQPLDEPKQSGGFTVSPAINAALLCTGTAMLRVAKESGASDDSPGFLTYAEGFEAFGEAILAFKMGK